MYQFIYLFAPGMLAWLVSKRLGSREYEEKYLLSVIQIIAYAFVNMAAVLTILKPIGIVAFAADGNGSLDIHYGESGLVLSIFMAFIEGYVVSKLQKADIEKWIGLKAAALKTQCIQRPQESVDKFIVNTKIKKTTLIQIVNFIGLLIVLYGIWTSLKMNFVNRSLWLDEASLAESLSVRSFWRLTETPLENSQAAPILYIYLVKILIHFFGNTEFVLRIYSVISFAASLFFVALIAKKILNIKFYMLASAYVANMGFLLRYSNEFKQYMSESMYVLAALIVYSWYSGHREERRAVILTAFLFMAFLWGANPVCFIIGGILLVELAGGVLSQDRIRTIHSMVIGAGVCISFAANYFYWLKDANSAVMQNYWKDHAFILIPNTLEKLSHDQNLLLNIFRYFSSGPLIYGLIMASFIIAIVEKDRMVKAVMCGFSLALFASSMHLFPMVNRLWCFSYPLFGLLIFYAADRLTGGLLQIMGNHPDAEIHSGRKDSLHCLISAVIMFALILTNTGITDYADEEAVFRGGEETNELIAYVQTHVADGEQVFVYCHSRAQVKYKIGYETDRIGNVSRDNIIWSAGSAEDEDNLMSDFERITEAESCWIITSHVQEPRWKPLKDKLEAAGTLEEILNSHNTYLYFFRT